MSWFARSIANTFQLDLNDDNDHPPNNNNNNNNNITTDQNIQQQHEEPDSPSSPNRGVKEDLSEITKTLTRQLWGVASFLAPPPTPDPDNNQPGRPDLEDAESEAEGMSGIKRDIAEIGGRFRSGISKLSNNINVDVSEITKLASSFMQLSPEDDGEAVGVTDEVLSFVRDITMHPETWLDFPLPDDDEDDDDAEDFELSDAQQEHALAVESLAPRLAALRIELCPGYMSESSFWKIYFVLLHPRLEPQAAELLSTPEIVKARASLTQALKAQSNSQTKVDDGSTTNFPYSEHKPESSQEEHSSVPLETSNTQSTTSVVSTDPESEKHYIPSEEVQIVDKSVIQEEPKNKTKVEDQNTPSNITSNDVEDKDEDDKWLEENSESVVTGTTTVPIDHDEDVSFSDLEEDDDGDASTNYKKTASGSDSSTKDSRDWVQLGSDSSSVDRAGQVSGAHNAEIKESNDWLDVDDIDVA